MQNMNGDQYSFMSGADSDRSDENSVQADILDNDINKGNNEDQANAHMAGTSPLMTPPPLYSTDDYKIDGM